MAQKKQTEIEKWHGLISMYEKILHPDFFNPIREQMFKVYDELKEKAYRDANISAEALEIEAELNTLRKRLVDICQDNHQSRWFMKKIFIKYLINKL